MRRTNATERWLRSLSSNGVAKAQAKNIIFFNLLATKDLTLTDGGRDYATAAKLTSIFTRLTLKWKYIYLDLCFLGRKGCSHQTQSQIREMTVWYHWDSYLLWDRGDIVSRPRICYNGVRNRSEFSLVSCISSYTVSDREVRRSYFGFILCHHKLYSACL